MTIAPINQKQTFFMNRALELGEESRIIAPPNPWVGCAIVKHGEIIAEGSTEAFGGSHAEVQALKQAGEEANGATVYVTLEPCPVHGKTPPCTDALIQAGVTRVVIGILDPDPSVQGKGVEKLQEAGIEVELGVLKQEVEASLKSYLHHRRTGLPFCILKAAISMDGKIAAKNGTSIWITGKQARVDVHQIRAESQAILIGTNTVLEDNPSLTVRHVEPKGLRPPLRVLLDTSGKIKPKGPLFDIDLAPTLIITSEKCHSSRIEDWKNAGCDVEVLPLDLKGNGVDLSAVLSMLGKRGIVQLLVEGGSRVFSSLLQDKLANRLTLYMGACLLGAEGVSLFSRLNLESIEDAIRMQLQQMVRLGKDVRLDYNCEE